MSKSRSHKMAHHVSASLVAVAENSSDADSPSLLTGGARFVAHELQGFAGAPLPLRSAQPTKTRGKTTTNRPLHSFPLAVKRLTGPITVGFPPAQTHTMDARSDDEHSSSGDDHHDDGTPNNRPRPAKVHKSERDKRTYRACLHCRQRKSRCDL